LTPRRPRTRKLPTRSHDGWMRRIVKRRRVCRLSVKTKVVPPFLRAGRTAVFEKTTGRRPLLQRIWRGRQLLAENGPAAGGATPEDGACPAAPPPFEEPPPGGGGCGGPGGGGPGCGAAGGGTGGGRGSGGGGGSGRGGGGGRGSGGGGGSGRGGGGGRGSGGGGGSGSGGGGGSGGTAFGAPCASCASAPRGAPLVPACCDALPRTTAVIATRSTLAKARRILFQRADLHSDTASALLRCGALPRPLRAGPSRFRW
jgi:hypothetical protein